MKIGIYDPYLKTLGGGENYILTIASCLCRLHSVSLFWHDTKILDEAQTRFNLDLSQVSITSNIFLPRVPLQQKIALTRSYDVIFFVSDGSIPLLFAKKNFLIIQHPLPWVKQTILTRLKLTRIKKILVYSEFVKKFLDNTFGKESFVLAPAIEQIPFDAKKKENIILTVGRFTEGMNTKKQAEMIDAFKQLYDKGFKGWELVLIGSSLKENSDFIFSLKKSAAGYPIKILPDASRELLVSYYQKAKIYWHAAGINEDLSLHPERAEHFGITTVEAMSAGAVPVVINAGGQTEIVSKGNAGILWKTIEELQEQTKRLAHDKTLLQEYAVRANKRAQDFSKETFSKTVETLID